VVVLTQGGEILMMERTRPRGFWQSVTGSLRWGESPREAAERELFEETGLRAQGRVVDLRHSERFPIVPPWRRRYAPHCHYNLEHWFRLTLPRRRTIRLNPAEHTRYRWLPIADAARLAFSRTNRAAILALLRS